MDHHAEYVGETLERAREGDPEAGREVLNQFVSTAVAGQFHCERPIDTAVLQYVALGLRNYLTTGGDLERALGIKRPNRRPRGNQRIVGYSLACAAAVELLMRRNKMRKTAALEAVVSATGRDRRTIMNDCKGWVSGSLNERYLEHLARPVAKSPNFPPLNSI